YRPAALGEKGRPLGFRFHNSAERAGRRLACTIASAPRPLACRSLAIMFLFCSPLAVGSSHGSLVRSRQTPARAHALLARPPCAGGRFCAPSAVSAAREVEAASSRRRPRRPPPRPSAGPRRPPPR